MNDLVTLSIGEDYHLKRGKDHIVYAGMPSENVYSIVQRKAIEYGGEAWNLFYPIKQHDITIDKVNLFVEKAMPGEIRLRIR